MLLLFIMYYTILYCATLCYMLSYIHTHITSHTFIYAPGTKERPIMVHRAIFGSLERFFGILIENTAGDFPLWLAPTHMRVLPVVDDVLDYCQMIKKKAEALGKCRCRCRCR